ncbi:PA4575 family protein [Pseudomonas mangiferae]|uniref:Uncharacterized protein n=1 Tax=Pseudomonas mangiferae TaxID=2593654 RepID=A0A553H2Z0_9PSED|nr:hypothetical protein [Pseudomonas mangiferae]TRX76114.1 hypothetical protein FM069_02695 [Pseudomonas mangiferae]
MSRNLILTRQCLGLTTRIECLIRPLGGENGLWTLLCAAGMNGAQPSAIRAQGPFHGPLAAESVLAAIVECLAELGYAEAFDPPIWRLHLLGELRRLDHHRCRRLGDCQLHPDR